MDVRYVGEVVDFHQPKAWTRYLLGGLDHTLVSEHASLRERLPAAGELARYIQGGDGATDVSLGSPVEPCPHM